MPDIPADSRRPEGPDPSRRRRALIGLGGLAAAIVAVVMLAVFVVVPQQNAASDAAAAERDRELLELQEGQQAELERLLPDCGASADLRETAISNAQATLASYGTGTARPGMIDLLEQTLTVTATTGCEDPGVEFEFSNRLGVIADAIVIDLMTADWLERLAAFNLDCPSIFLRYVGPAGCQGTDPLSTNWLFDVPEPEWLLPALTSPCSDFWTADSINWGGLDEETRVVIVTEYEMTFLSGKASDREAVHLYCSDTADNLGVEG